MGEEFTVSMELYNPHAESVELDNIEVSSQTLEFFEILALYPDGFRSDFFGMGVWYIEKDIAPTAQQIELGVCNAFEDCTPVTHPIDIVSR